MYMSPLLREGTCNHAGCSGYFTQVLIFVTVRQSKTYDGVTYLEQFYDDDISRGFSYGSVVSRFDHV